MFCDVVPNSEAPGARPLCVDQTGADCHAECRDRLSNLSNACVTCMITSSNSPAIRKIGFNVDDYTCVREAWGLFRDCAEVCF